MRYRDTGNYQDLGVPVDDGLVFFSIILGLALSILVYALNATGWLFGE